MAIAGIWERAKSNVAAANYYFADQESLSTEAWRHSFSSRTDQGSGQHRKIMKAVVPSCLYMALIYEVNAGGYNGLKPLFHRSRPFVQQTVMLPVSSTAASGLPGDSSFPSGHDGHHWCRARRSLVHPHFRTDRH